MKSDCKNSNCRARVLGVAARFLARRIWIGTILFSTAGASMEAKDIPLSKVPPSVIEAAKKAVSEFEITSAEKEWERGRTLYEINGVSKADGYYYEVEVTRKGAVVEIERSKTPEDDDDEGGDD